MKTIKDFLKGILIGIANIIPGVSGGTMAVSMGVYDRIIFAITGFRKHFKESVITLLPYGVGAVAGIGALSFLVKHTLTHYPLQTGGLFIGLVLGGVPVIFKKIKGKKTSVFNVSLFILFFLLVAGMAFVGGHEGTATATDITVNPITVLQLFLVGIVAAATMVIPGVSGSLVLMILGFYSIIISSISRFLEALAAFDITTLLHCAGILIPLGLGILAGIGAVAKLVELLFKKAPVPTYSAILGLIMGSPIALLYEAGITNVGFFQVSVTVLTLIAGFLISYFLGKEKN